MKAAKQEWIKLASIVSGLFVIYLCIYAGSLFNLARLDFFAKNSFYAVIGIVIAPIMCFVCAIFLRGKKLLFVLIAAVAWLISAAVFCKDAINAYDNWQIKKAEIANVSAEFSTKKQHCVEIVDENGKTKYIFEYDDGLPHFGQAEAVINEQTKFVKIY